MPTLYVAAPFAQLGEISMGEVADGCQVLGQVGRGFQGGIS